jgi:predicted XRE-type DNA-binding protein
MAQVTRKNRPGHVTRGVVLRDLGLPPEQAQALAVKADLHRALLRLIAQRKFTRKQLGQVLGEPASRISELLHGKIASTSIEKLLRYASRMGCTPHIVLKKARRAA